MGEKIATREGEELHTHDSAYLLIFLRPSVG